MNGQLIDTLKSTADFLQGIYADPSVTLRVREASRIKEIALRQAIIDFEGVLTALANTTTKPVKKLKVVPMEADDSRIIPMEDVPTGDFIGEFIDKGSE